MLAFSRIYNNIVYCRSAQEHFTGSQDEKADKM